MKSHSGIEWPIAIDRPMVIIPADDYVELLREASHLPTPLLDKEIAQARAPFRKGKFTKWEKIKHGLI